MHKSILGSRIQILRKEKGITQEELGREVGVTAQAVSNWECGGTPDAELLPKLAEILGVSIDNLYGKTDEIKKNLEAELMWTLYHTEKEKRFEKAYQYCWYIHQGLYNLDPQVLANTMKEHVLIPDETKFTSTLLFEEGVSTMRINEDVHNFYLMPTPEEGFQEKLLNPERYERFFQILGKKNRVKTLIYLYSKKNKALTAERLAQHLSFSKQEAADILEDLCSVELLQKIEMDVEEGEQRLYKCMDYYTNNALLIPFLYTTTDLIDKAMFGLGSTTGKVDSVL